MNVGSTAVYPEELIANLKDISILWSLSRNVVSSPVEHRSCDSKNILGTILCYWGKWNTAFINLAS